MIRCQEETAEYYETGNECAMGSSTRQKGKGT